MVDALDSGVRRGAGNPLISVPIIRPVAKLRQQVMNAHTSRSLSLRFRNVVHHCIYCCRQVPQCSVLKYWPLFRMTSRRPASP